MVARNDIPDRGDFVWIDLNLRLSGVTREPLRRIVANQNQFHDADQPIVGDDFARDRDDGKPWSGWRDDQSFIELVIQDGSLLMRVFPQSVIEIGGGFGQFAA